MEEKERGKGHITRQGNKRVRYILNQAAWGAIKTRKPYQMNSISLQSA